MSTIYRLLLLLLLCSFNTAPVAYQGRFRPVDVYAKLWLKNVYGKDHVKKSDVEAFGIPGQDPLHVLFKLHFLGIESLKDAPLIQFKNPELKQALGLDVKQSHFSYFELKNLFNVSQSSIPDSLNEESERIRSVLSMLEQMNGQLMPYEMAYQNQIQNMTFSNGMSINDIALSLENIYPFAMRIRQSDQLFLMLPSSKGKGEWVPLKSLKIKNLSPIQKKLTLANNFTQYNSEQFEQIRKAYLDLEEAYLKENQDVSNKIRTLFALLESSYQESLQGKAYVTSATGKSLDYPTMNQLRAENIYYGFPWLIGVIFFYIFTALLLILNIIKKKDFLLKCSYLTFALAFVLHTFLLALRCYILSRPPVSNMYETVIYVPWIAVILSLGLYAKIRQPLILFSGVCSTVILLILLEVTQLNSGLENVQAVLDSQYWLIIHVLMVVGSYGAFILGGVLGHIYLSSFIIQPMAKYKDQISKALLQSLYIGIALLIPGTILGGVWAAESWGRFWDWDPKESWAFISACTYLFIIHAYTFNYIKEVGLAVGSIFGLIVISFTWYGVNYILGTGLHSYGFGAGGVIYYLFFIAFEIFFLITTFFSRNKNIFLIKGC